MDYIPILVIGRVAVYADNDSLVLLSCCSKWLRYCVSQQNNLWHQRYKQYYNLADDNEMKWLAWYVKTVHVSKLLAAQTKKTINNIEWFYAFCYRRATDANWLKDTPYPIKDVVLEEPANIRSIVLQRIAYRHTNLRKCFIVEQCQPTGEAPSKRFWRLRKLFRNDENYMFQVKQCLISDRFVVVISEQANSADFNNIKPCIVSIWPVHLVSIMRPRQFSCLCDNASICGRWIMVNYLEPVFKKTDKSNVLTTTRVFDLANGQMCMGIITTYHGGSFLLRATEETATVFSRSLYHSDIIITVKWNVWEFSNRHLGYGPRCLMQGEICFKKFNDFSIIIKKLDDNRVLIENTSPLAANMLGKNSADEISMAMILTECGYSNICIKNVKPIWTRSEDIYGTVPLFGSDCILVIAKKRWTVHSIIDGATLAHINIETLGSVLETPRLFNINVYTRRLSLYVGRFVLYNSIRDGTFTAVDLFHSNRITNLGITNSKYLHKKSYGYRGIIAKFNDLIKYPFLLSDTVSTRNAMLMEDDKEYKIIDLSF